MATRDIPSGSDMRKQYPGNSFKQRDDIQETLTKAVDESKPQVKQVAKGKVRKQSLLKKFSRYIIEDSVESAKEKTLGEIIIPGVKTLIFDTLTDMLDIILFGGNGAPMGRYAAAPRARKGQTSYDKYYNSKTTGNGSRGGSYRDAPYDPDDIILDTRAQANNALNELNNIIMKYGQASVANFYDIVGVTGEWTDNRYGWTSLRGAGIKPVRDGFMILLPPTVVLDD